jgi:hypothetical protein
MIKKYSITLFSLQHSTSYHDDIHPWHQPPMTYIIALHSLKSSFIYIHNFRIYFFHSIDFKPREEYYNLQSFAITELVAKFN